MCLKVRVRVRVRVSVRIRVKVQGALPEGSAVMLPWSEACGK